MFEAIHGYIGNQSLADLHKNMSPIQNPLNDKGSSLTYQEGEELVQ